jgi:hypothetical protein
MELNNSGCFNDRIGRNCFNISERKDRLYVNEVASADGVDNIEYFTGYNFLPFIVPGGSFIKDFGQRRPLKSEK